MRTPTGERQNGNAVLHGRQATRRASAASESFSIVLCRPNKKGLTVHPQAFKALALTRYCLSRAHVALLTFTFTGNRPIWVNLSASACCSLTRWASYVPPQTACGPARAARWVQATPWSRKGFLRRQPDDCLPRCSADSARSAPVSPSRDDHQQICGWPGKSVMRH